MTEARTGAEACGSGTPAGLKGAMAEFVNELKAFRENVEEKLQAQDKRMTMLDRKTAFRGRSPLSQAAEIEAPHQKAFAAYLRRGDDSGLRSLALEEKAMASGTDGGYLAAPTISETVQAVLRTTGSIRSLATVVQVEASSYEVLMDKSDIGAGWASEVTSTADSVRRVGGRGDPGDPRLGEGGGVLSVRPDGAGGRKRAAGPLERCR